MFARNTLFILPLCLVSISITLCTSFNVYRSTSCPVAKRFEWQSKIRSQRGTWDSATSAKSVSTCRSSLFLSKSSSIFEKIRVTPNQNSDFETTGDPEYPYQFTGRLWYSPRLVRTTVAEEFLEDPSITILSFLGYTLGGSVALEYDTSPVGPYREFVTMSALVMKRGTIGQWGSRLFVSTQKAEVVCKEIWGVPAELARINFLETNTNTAKNHDGKQSRSSVLELRSVPDNSRGLLQRISVRGWESARTTTDSVNNKDEPRKGNIPIYWTPTIKALWSPYMPLPPEDYHGDALEKNQKEPKSEKLPLHKLRLSASAVRLHWSGIRNSQGPDDTEIPFGLGLVVDNVSIEIGKQCGTF